MASIHTHWTQRPTRSDCEYLPCFRHVTGHSCHGPTHQCTGHGSVLHTRSFSLGRDPSAFDQQLSSSTIPLCSSWQMGSRRCVPPPQVAEHAAQSPSFHIKTGTFDEFIDSVYSYLMPGLLVLPRTRIYNLINV